MSEIKRIKKLWPRLSKYQTLLIAINARWLLYSDAYVALPYTLRRLLQTVTVHKDKTITLHWL